MDSLSIQNTLRSVSGAGQLARPEVAPMRPETAFPAAAPAGGPSFSDTLSSYLENVNETVLNADKGIADLAAGKSASIHSTLIDMQKADIQVRLLVETRNKVIGAYQEIMRMQA